MKRRYKSKSFLLINSPLALGLAIFLFCVLYLLFDLFSFEYVYTYRLFGLTGILIFVFITVASIHLLYLLIRPDSPGLVRTFKRHFIYFLPAVVCTLLLLDWIFLELPLTKRLYSYSNDTITEVIPDDLRSFSLYKNAPNHSKHKIRIMYERIQANRSHRYLPMGFASEIDRLASYYEVSPELIFYWLYMGSFWGEAASAKVPFFDDMTAETFRDYVQIHLPSWFIESKLRVYVIESEILATLFGDFWGNKLRYAFQKANYDISAEPYDVYIYTDIYVVLEKYKEAFPDIFNGNSRDPLDQTIAASMAQLSKNFSFSPCTPIYDEENFKPEFYDRNRESLMKFGRAVFYKVMFDMQFATKIQVLVAKKIESNYQTALGKSFWEQISQDQRLGLIAMLRDVYTPNIGKVSHNLYNLPEFNCAPQEFVIESLENLEFDLKPKTLWRPHNYKHLWAGATKKLQILSEVLEATRGTPLAGIPPSATIETERNNVRR